MDENGKLGQGAEPWPSFFMRNVLHDGVHLATMDHNPDTTNFVPSVIGYHRSLATGKLTQALTHARAAMESAPCDNEAARWHRAVTELEYQTAKGLRRMFLGFGIRGTN